MKDWNIYNKLGMDASSCGHGRIFTCRRYKDSRLFATDVSMRSETKTRAASTVPQKCKETWEKLKAHFANGPPAVCNEQQQATASVVVLDVDLISLVWCFFLKHFFYSRTQLRRIIRLSVYATVKIHRRNHRVIRRLPGGHRSTKFTEIHRACQLLRSTERCSGGFFDLSWFHAIPAVQHAPAPLGQPNSLGRCCCPRDIKRGEKTRFSLVKKTAASCKIDHDGCLKTEQFVAGFHGREDIFWQQRVNMTSIGIQKVSSLLLLW